MFTLLVHWLLVAARLAEVRNARLHEFRHNRVQSMWARVGLPLLRGHIVNTIVLCEPQCCGFEHSNINAALLAVVRQAFPTSKIIFFAEEKHLDFVQGLLSDHAIDSVELRRVVVPERSTHGFARCPGELALFGHVFAFAQRHAVSRILFTSITGEGLYSLKALMFRYRYVHCYVIPHTILASALNPPPSNPVRLPFWFRIPFQFCNPARLTYILLGAPIRQQIVSRFPRLESNLAALDHPYFFEPVNDEHVQLHEAITFGALGVASVRKGTPQFFRLAERISRTATQLRAQFLIAGPIVDPSLNRWPGCIEVPSPNAPLTAQAFAECARRIDYAVFLHDPGQYRVIASGALFDAFSYGIPIIAIRNPFFEHYFSLMGDIGYLCETPEEVESAICAILNSRPRERYRRQHKNILEGRRRMDIPRLAEHLHRILGSDA